MRNLTALELSEYLNQSEPKPLLLDVREPWEYQKAHLADSRLIPMRQIPASLQELDTEQEIVVICHHGVRSRAVAQYLEQNNFKNVINLHGGINAWAHEVDTSIPTY